MSSNEISAEIDGIVIAKVNWAHFYQGEPETVTRFEDGENFERFNFKRMIDGCFYGSIPRNAPDKNGRWLRPDWQARVRSHAVRRLSSTRPGQRPSKYIAAGIREVVEEDFRQPIEKAVEGPIRSIEVAAYHAREAVEQIKREARFQNWTVFALILALGFALGAFGTYFFFTRQVSALNSCFDHLEQLLVAPLPAPADTHAPMPQAGKKHGQH